MNTPLLVLPIAAPAALATLYLAAGWRPATAWTGLASPATILVCAAALARAITHHGPQTAYGGLLHADALTVWILLGIGAVALLACAASPAYLADEHDSAGGGPAGARRYGILIHLFLATMTAATMTENLGVLWICVEATTIVTAFLVGHHRSRAGVEAAWKYVVICSAGISLAFLGTVITYDAARHAGIPEDRALNWTVLLAHADQLDPGTMRLGIALVILGFGAKAGLLPLHAWLPDAHSQAPAPVSALMSGVLLAVSFTAVLRYKTIADLALGTGYARTLLLLTGLATLALSAALLLTQHDYKRMLAYSSMEHMALIAVAAAVGTQPAVAALLLHMAGHGMAKTAAFCSAGHILHLEHTARISSIRGLLSRAPGIATLFALAILALLALPPFSLFASELGIVRATFTAGLGWAGAAALALVLLAFAAITTKTTAMLLGRAAEGPGAATLPIRLPFTAWAAPVTAVVCCAALGVSVKPLSHLLTLAAATVVGGR